MIHFLLTILLNVTNITGMKTPVLIPVSRNNFAIIDASDAKRVRETNWFFHNEGYAMGRINGAMTLMHRFIMGAQLSSLGVDHRNHNGLDNRRSNLRLSTQGQNLANSRKRKFAKPNRITTSKYKGVSWRKDRQRWTAYVGTGEKRLALGCFASEEEAALAYNRGALEMFGEFAKLNVIEK